ncbi:TPA: hypothetical protein ACWXBU_005440, partial [Klebsiella pneumoniae]
APSAKGDDKFITTDYLQQCHIFNLGCRGYVGKPGGERENYLTWVRDLANGEYKLPWDENVKIRDGWKYYPDGVQLGPLPK